MKSQKKELWIRPHQVKDARSFYHILTSGKFEYFPLNVKSIEAEKKFLRQSIKNWRFRVAFNFSVLQNEEVVGSVGIIPEQCRPYNAEIGYFIAREHHGKGLALQAVKLAENYAIDNLKYINRLHAYIITDNKQSVRVVEKAGYEKEGILRKFLKCGENYCDAYSFSRIIR